MNKIQINIAEIKANLRNKRVKILSLSPEKALNAILDEHQPAALVHSFPEEDFYFLIHEIGIEDSRPLLSLASNRQIEYLLDLEVWEKDRIEIKSVTAWFDLLFTADPNRFITLFFKQKIEFIEFYLFKNMEVLIREHDQDPSCFEEGFFTFDDVFYIRFKEHNFDIELADSETDDTESRQITVNTFNNLRNEFLSKFLKHFAAYDHVAFQSLMLEFQSIISAETEEETYRLRNVRLAEKGFLPFDEAIGIYQPLSSMLLKKQSRKIILKDNSRNTILPVPYFPARELNERNLFTDSLRTIQTDNILQQIQSEFAGLCNQIISADQKKIRSRKELKKIVKKACGYLSIALEHLTAPGKREDTNLAAADTKKLIQRYPLADIFKVGYGLSLELKWTAQKWYKKSWFLKENLPLGFWGEEWMGVLGGLLIKKPLFFDNYKTGLLYREFESIKDIKKTENVLNRVIAFDTLLSLMSLELKPFSSHSMLSCQNLILTLWARHHLGLSGATLSLVPLKFDEFKIFFKDLFVNTVNKNHKKLRVTSMNMKESFLSFLSDKTGLKSSEITQQSGRTLENLFKRIEEEYSEVSKENLDPRYINLFILEK